MTIKYVRFEYDVRHQGGSHVDTGVLGGNYHLVPLDVVLKSGVQSFVEATGVDTKHLIAYSTDLLYDRSGNLLEE